MWAKCNHIPGKWGRLIKKEQDEYVMEVTVLMVNRRIMRGYIAQDLLSWNCLSTHTKGINLMLVDKQMHRHGHAWVENLRKLQHQLQKIQ